VLGDQMVFSEVKILSNSSLADDDWVSEWSV